MASGQCRTEIPLCRRAGARKPIPDDWHGRREEARRLFADRIYACREQLGLGSDPDLDKLRCNNCGLRDERVVMIDYGDSFPPLYATRVSLLDDLDSPKPPRRA